MSTFHLHDGIVRNVFAAGRFLGLHAGLIIVVAGDNDNAAADKALKGARLALLGVREYVGLERKKAVQFSCF